MRKPIPQDVDYVSLHSLYPWINVNRAPAISGILGTSTDCSYSDHERANTHANANTNMNANINAYTHLNANRNAHVNVNANAKREWPLSATVHWCL